METCYPPNDVLVCLSPESRWVLNTVVLDEQHSATMLKRITLGIALFHKGISLCLTDPSYDVFSPSEAETAYLRPTCCLHAVLHQHLMHHTTLV